MTNATDPELIEAADVHVAGTREALSLLDGAENLIAVLLASIENEGDSRAMQAETVLRIAREKLSEVHGRIDRQDAQYRNLFVAYFKRRGRATEGEG